MKLKTADELWQDYKRVLPVGASATQVRETRRAFLSGIYSLLTELSSVTDNDEDELIMRHLDAMTAELQARLAMMIFEDTGGVAQ